LSATRHPCRRDASFASGIDAPATDAELVRGRPANMGKVELSNGQRRDKITGT
jgi:hypothetical protein